jgi:hypothetical protein
MEQIKLESIQEIVENIQKEQMQILKQRNSEYGQSYKKVGEIMQILFPKGIFIGEKEQQQQFDLFKQVVGKLARFSHQFPNEIHRDSLIDAGNYITLLLGVIEQKQQVDKYVNSLTTPAETSNENSNNDIF